LVAEIGVLIYLHGFRSSPASIKARRLGQYMETRGLAARYACPLLPHEPAAAVALIEKRIRASPSPVTLVGSSLGGYYATWLAEQYELRAVLINPAVAAARSLIEYVGRQENMYSGEAFEFTEGHIAQLEAITVERITRPQRYLLMVEAGDELLDYRQSVAKYEGARQIVHEGGDHSFTRFADYMGTILDFAGIKQRQHPMDSGR
jgi:predicted esterase YcpF (UPF0227 family)